MGKLGNRPLRGENKRPSPTAHRTAIFLPSQGARIEGTKPSVLDRLPCWGRWRGGSWGKRSGEAEGGLPLTPAPPRPPQPSVARRQVADGKLGHAGRGRPEPRLRTGLSPGGARGCGSFPGEGRPRRRDPHPGPGGCWQPQPPPAGWLLPLPRAAHQDPLPSHPTAAPASQALSTDGGQWTPQVVLPPAKSLALSQDRNQAPEGTAFLIRERDRGRGSLSVVCRPLAP